MIITAFLYSQNVNILEIEAKNNGLIVKDISRYFMDPYIKIKGNRDVLNHFVKRTKFLLVEVHETQKEPQTLF